MMMLLICQSFYLFEFLKKSSHNSYLYNATNTKRQELQYMMNNMMGSSRKPKISNCFDSIVVEKSKTILSLCSRVNNNSQERRGIGQIHLTLMDGTSVKSVIQKILCISFEFNENWRSCNYLCRLKLHQFFY